MINFEIKQLNKKFKLPEGRHEVTYQQWTDCLPYLKDIEEARELLDGGKFLEAEQKAVEYSARIVSILSGADYDDVLKIQPYQLSNLFHLFLRWIGDQQQPKRLFQIGRRKFEVPDFSNASAGEFMDCMSLLSMIVDDNDAEKGLVIASIYLREEGVGYVQNIEQINERKEFFKKYAKLDLYHSCAFFLLNSLNTLEEYTELHSIDQEAENLTSTLNVWDIFLCLPVSQKLKS